MMRSRIATVMLAAVTVVLAASCGDTNATPAELIAGFRSHASVEETEAIVERSGRRWVLVDDFPGAGHTSQSYSVKPFEDRGFTGEASVQFFDGKLVRIVFFPQEPSPYLERLASDLRIELDKSVPSPTDNRVVVRTGTYASGGRFASWEDRALAAEMERWLD
jgi:hypothetical protein